LIHLTALDINKVWMNRYVILNLMGYEGEFQTLAIRCFFSHVCYDQQTRDLIAKTKYENVDLVMSQAQVSADRACLYLKTYQGDWVEAILHLAAENAGMEYDDYYAAIYPNRSQISQKFTEGINPSDFFMHSWSHRNDQIPPKIIMTPLSLPSMADRPGGAGIRHLYERGHFGDPNDPEVIDYYGRRLAIETTYK